jgi:hypothetical protein
LQDRYIKSKFIIALGSADFCRIEVVLLLELYYHSLKFIWQTPASFFPVWCKIITIMSNCGLFSDIKNYAWALSSATPFTNWAFFGMIIFYWSFLITTWISTLSLNFKCTECTLNSNLNINYYSRNVLFRINKLQFQI